MIIIAGCINLRVTDPGDPVPDVAPAHRLHGHPPQERARGEEALQVCDAESKRRHCDAQCDLPRGGTVRHGHLHTGGHLLLLHLLLLFVEESDQ